MSNIKISSYYVFFFLYLEPLSAVAGALAALFPASYLRLLSPTIDQPAVLDVAVTTTVNQLANLYLFFAMSEAFVLRAARSNLRVWRALIIAMLLADFGHLISGFRLGFRQYWSMSEWSAMEFGSIGFVYVGAATRIMFLYGVGIHQEDIQGTKPSKSQ